MKILAFTSLLIFFLAGTFILTLASSGFRRLRRSRSKEELNALGNQFVYTRFQKLIFPKAEFETLLFSIYCAQNIMRFCSGLTTLILLSQLQLLPFSAGWITGILAFLFTIEISLLVGDFLPRQWNVHNPQSGMAISAPISSLLLLLCFPLSYPFLRFFHISTEGNTQEKAGEPISQLREKIIEIIEEASVENRLDVSDKKLIESAVSFRDRVVREVMVPRVEIFALSSTTSIRDAAQYLSEQGFSRTPVYKKTVDNIIGILMYKDLLEAYMQCEQDPQKSAILDTPIETVIKTALYTPETKRVPDLLQEFRKKQTHIAIVVDEYGGTEGVVTIEDILEEIVGEIADEYDEKKSLYTILPSGGWLVDARMTILDADEQLGLKIPQDGEYDTIGGYIFHRAGTIPTKGLVIHHDDFELEILSSTDRSVEKVRITPIAHNEVKPQGKGTA